MHLALHITAVVQCCEEQTMEQCIHYPHDFAEVPAVLHINRAFRCIVVDVQDATAKECGLHSGNVVDTAADQAADEQRDLFTSGDTSPRLLTARKLCLRTFLAVVSTKGGGGGR